MRTQTHRRSSTQIHHRSVDKRRGRSRRCNICNARFSAHYRYELFCKQCREESELYHFYETVPHFIGEA